jgi:pimeloyl-ACP methyl ester carboxylesterase
MRMVPVILALTSMLAASAPKARVADFDGVKVHYDSWGKGSEAVVLVHGWTCNAEFWRANAPDLAKDYRVITVDLPGHGRSDKPQANYTMEYFARSVDAVLKHAKVKRAVLAGHSMGTPVVRVYYRLYPQKTAALIAVDGALRPMMPKEQMDRLLASLRGPDFSKTAAGMVGGMTQPMRNAADRELVTRIMLAAPQHVAVSAMEGMADPAVFEGSVSVPVLAIMASSPNWDADYVRQVRAMTPKLEYQSWGGVSHFLMMDEPAKFNATVREWLKKNRIL